MSATLSVRDVVQALGLAVGAGEAYLDQEVTGGYASDLLSCVMAQAQAGNVWVTLQSHLNVIAVASLLDLSCVIITEGAQLEETAVARANEKGIPVLLTPEGTYTTVSRLWDLGIRDSG